MAELTIRLVVDPATGKKDVRVSLRSDADALPMEHEEAHRAIVEQLLAGGALRPEELGRVVVTREGAKDAAAEEAASPEGAPERVGQKS
jgi:hypothetical protein